MAPSDDPLVSPISISLTCGQDVEVPTLMEVATVLIQCTPGQYNGSDPLTMQVYKDGELIPGGTSPYKIVSPTDDDLVHILLYYLLKTAVQLVQCLEYCVQVSCLDYNSFKPYIAS